MSSVSDIIFHGHRSTTESSLSRHKERLDQIIKAWKFKLHPVVGDGNCFFSAVAFYLIINEQAFLQHDSKFFTSKGLETSDHNKLSMMHRQLTVKEWKSNASFYQNLLITNNVVLEADKYLQSGVYCGELGDTMVLALSNALQLVTIVLTSINYHPIIHILPRQVSVPISLFLAYTQYGPGHYDGLTEDAKDSPSTDSASQPLANVVSHCSCGKNDKKNSTHCHPKVKKYTSVCLCPCYNSNVRCSDNCRCKCCNNPLGKHNVAEYPPARKRPRHSWQKTMQSSAKFAIHKGESINPGSRSLLEFFAMEQVLSHCNKQEILVTAENIATIYNAMAEVVVSHDCVLPLGTKSISEVSKFMREHEHNLDFYRTLCITCLELED